MDDLSAVLNRLNSAFSCPGGVNVTVSYTEEAGKTINEVMLDGGCVQKLRVSTVPFLIKHLFKLFAFSF